MKFLVDECVGSTVALWLKSKGYDVVSVCDECPGITDNQVLKKSLDEGRILITSDKDFGEMVFKKKLEHCGIVLLRLSQENPQNKIKVIDQILNKYSDSLWHNFVVVGETSIRIIQRSLS